MIFAFVGKSLQLAGLIEAAYGFYVGVKMEGALTDELLHLGIGFVIFSLGTVLFKHASKKA